VTATPSPLVVAVEMGYGHLRAARPLADALGQPVLHVDRAPLAGKEEQRIWRRVRSGYEWISRVSQIPLAGGPLRLALDQLTSIPRLHPYRDLSGPTRGVVTLERLMRRNLGQGLVAELRRSGAPLLTTFYSPAIAADRAGLDNVHCVVTDTDVNRIWAPVHARTTRIHYLAPTHQVTRRLRSYGVPAERITFTGFPLPDELVGGSGLATLTRNLAARLVRLDPAGELRRELAQEIAHFVGPLPGSQEGVPPLLVFAVGGAGAQASTAQLFLPGMRRSIEEGRLRVALVAGVKPAVAEVFHDALRRSGLTGAIGNGVEVLLEPDFDSYYSAFNALVARADILWTKPSELCFYAALGLPLVCGPPVGVHERYNRRWVREAGAGVKQRDPRFAAEWLDDMLRDGSLAAAAWSGFLRLPKFGLYRILEAVMGSAWAERRAGAAEQR
jgi:hypothetical protein